MHMEEEQFHQYAFCKVLKYSVAWDSHCFLACPSEISATNLLILRISNEFRARRAAKEAKEAPAQPAPEKVKVEVKKFVKIGRPGYKGTSVMPVTADT